jgi:hypothetical protein
MSAAHDFYLRVGRIGKLDKIINNLLVTASTGLHRRKTVRNEYKANPDPFKNTPKEAK